MVNVMNPVLLLKDPCSRDKQISTVELAPSVTFT